MKETTEEAFIFSKSSLLPFFPLSSLCLSASAPAAAADSCLLSVPQPQSLAAGEGQRGGKE